MFESLHRTANETDTKLWNSVYRTLWFITLESFMRLDKEAMSQDEMKKTI